MKIVEKYKKRPIRGKMRHKVKKLQYKGNVEKLINKTTDQQIDRPIDRCN